MIVYVRFWRGRRERARAWSCRWETARIFLITNLVYYSRIFPLKSIEFATCRGVNIVY